MNNKDLLSLLFEGCGVVDLFFKTFSTKNTIHKLLLAMDLDPIRGGEGRKRNQEKGKSLDGFLITKGVFFGLLWNENGPNVND